MNGRHVVVGDAVAAAGLVLVAVFGQDNRR